MQTLGENVIKNTVLGNCTELNIINISRYSSHVKSGRIFSDNHEELIYYGNNVTYKARPPHPFPDAYVCRSMRHNTF